jgi:SAM-dependent methyltransferase
MGEPAEPRTSGVAHVGTATDRHDDSSVRAGGPDVGPVTFAQLRVPQFGAQYLEQARRQLFARHPDYLPYLLHHLDIHPGMTVLEVGAGTGVYTRLMASQLQGEGRAVGIEVQPSLVQEAARRAQAEGWGALIDFQIGDASDLPFPDASFDLVFCNSLLWLLPDPVRALKEMRRVLRPGCRAFAAEPDGGLVHSYDPDRPRLSELDLRFQECFVRGALKLDGYDYEIGRRLPSLFLAAAFVRVRAFPRLFVAAGCDLGDQPQRAAAERLLEYRQGLASLTSTDEAVRAARERRAELARAGGMSDEELAEHEKLTVEWLKERVDNPQRIFYDGAVYTYGGILCEGLRYDEVR